MGATYLCLDLGCQCVWRNGRMHTPSEHRAHSVTHFTATQKNTDEQYELSVAKS